MSLPPGMRLGPYEIVAPLGAGGMGEVYRARDTQLKREVALKVLPAAFTSDADRLARFQREAELLATLNHPHIAAIYGLERTDATTALVLELVEGQTLADRIARGPIPLDEAVPIARQIADALESAHDRGIIHRDLKPANVKVRPDGTVKVLDFGLAKALDEEGAEPPRSQGASLSPTMTSPAMTRLGIILGTAAYMSPEQARGRPADRRSDIWAFGCVLYEMLTGRSIFGGDEVSDTLAAVLRAEPDWNALPADTPPPIRRLLERCLRKDPRQRLPHIGAARLELDNTDLGGASAGQQATPPRPRLAWGVAAGALLLAAALTIPASRYFQRQAMVALPQYRLDVSTPSTEDLTSFAISPDGLRLVFSAAAGGRQQLWLRDLGQSTSRPLPGTDGGRLPFWSPSSRSIGFFTGSGLYRLDLDGGTPRFLAPISAGLGGSWGVDDVIVFAPGTALPLQRVSASGGGATKAVEFADGINGHRFPHFLPGTRSFLVHGRGARTGVLLATLDSQQATWLTEADAGGLFVPETPSGTGDQLSNGWVLFVRGRALVARRFDRDARALIGDAVTLADNVGTTPGPTFGAAASVSVSGVVAYRSADRAPRQLQWFDRSGKPLAAVGPADATLANPELSPDGRIAVERFRDNNTDIWILDGDRAPRRLTDNDARDYFPVWADNHTLFFASTRENGFGVYQRRADGTGSESQLFKSDRAFVPIDVSPDKSALLYFQENAATGPDIGIRLLTDAPGTPQDSTIIGKKFREMWAQFSPRGDWIAYQSEESNEFEIYITPYRSRGGVTPVSVNGGIAARWAVDGEELYYIAPDGTIMVVDVPARGSGSDFGAPRRLFQPNIVGGGSAVVGLRQQYDVDARGRFLVNTNVNAAVAQTPPITLLLNADAFRRTP